MKHIHTYAHTNIHVHTDRTVYDHISAPPKLAPRAIIQAQIHLILEVDIDKCLCRDYRLPCPSSLLVQKLDCHMHA